MYTFKKTQKNKKEVSEHMNLKYGISIVLGSTLFSKAANHRSGIRPPSILKPITKVLSLESEENLSKNLGG